MNLLCYGFKNKTKKDILILCKRMNNNLQFKICQTFLALTIIQLESQECQMQIFNRSLKEPKSNTFMVKLNKHK